MWNEVEAEISSKIKHDRSADAYHRGRTDRAVVVVLEPLLIRHEVMFARLSMTIALPTDVTRRESA